MKIRVIGTGQSLRGDDAAGLEAVKLWQVLHPDSAAKVQVELSDLPGLSLLDLLEGVEAAIIVDAVQDTTSAGNVLCLGMDELAGFIPGSGSAHGWGVAETLQLGKAVAPALEKCRITLIGIVGKDFRMGTGLSPEVRKALARAVEMLESEIQSLL